MRVLHVVPWYEPAWSTGGTAIATSTLCRALAAKGIDVTVYTTNDKGEGKYLDVPLNTPVELGGVKVWYFSCGFLGNWKAAAYSRNLSQKLRDSIDSFDLIHIGATRHWHGFQVHKLCKLGNKPYIITPHASLSKYWVKNIGNPIFKAPYMHFIDSHVIKQAYAVHYLCEGERQLSKKYDYGSRSFIVPNGIVVKDYERDLSVRNVIRQQYGISDESVVLLSLGRIHPQKNIHHVIKVLKDLPASVKLVFFFIVGPVYDQKYYQGLCDLIGTNGLRSTVTFIPPVPKSEVKKWYSASDLLVLPSKIEGISMTLIEALAASLPVLVSRNVANFREIEQDGVGIIVDPTAQSISQGLQSIISSPDKLERLSHNARRSAMKRYSIDNVADLMIKAYKNVLTGEREPELQWR